MLHQIFFIYVTIIIITTITKPQFEYKIKNIALSIMK